MSREKQLFSVEAEQGLLGAVMLDNAVLDRIGALEGGDFYLGAHRPIWRAIGALVRDGQVADVISVATKLQEMGELEHVGDLQYLGGLVQAVASAATAPAFSKVIRERALDRRLVEVAGAISELAHGLGPVSKRIDEAQALVMGIAESSNDREPVLIDRLLPEALEDIERRYENDGELQGISTGLRDLDGKTQGLQSGDLVVVAGRPSMGKTSLILQNAIHAAQHGKTAFVASMEMSKQQLVQKAIAHQGRVSLEKLRSGKLEQDDFTLIAKAMGRLSESKLVIDDTPALSVEQLRVRARGVKRRHGLDIIFVDYLQLMSGDGDNENVRIEGISRGLKGLAREMNVPVVVLSQLNRSLEQRSDKRPTMSDLRSSGAIEQDADVILFIYRDEVYNPNTQDVGVAELIISKQRMGPTGIIGVSWLGEWGAFADREWARRAPEPPARKGRTHDDAF